jgi:hypothetical protein
LKLDFSLSNSTKINSKWNKYLNIGPETSTEGKGKETSKYMHSPLLSE